MDEQFLRRSYQIQHCLRHKHDVIDFLHGLKLGRSIATVQKLIEDGII